MFQIKFEDEALFTLCPVFLLFVVVAEFGTAYVPLSALLRSSWVVGNSFNFVGYLVPPFYFFLVSQIFEHFVFLK